MTQEDILQLIRKNHQEAKKLYDISTNEKQRYAYGMILALRELLWEIEKKIRSEKEQS